MNTGEADMDVIGERTPIRPRTVGGCGRVGEPGPTDGGRRLPRDPREPGARVRLRDLSGRTVLIQGAGGVGSALADHLAAAGCDGARRRRRSEPSAAVASRAGGRTVAPDRIADTECDVFSPCAVGGVLDPTPPPGCAAGSSPGRRTTSSPTPEIAEAIHARGILYAPDYVINGGGVIGVIGIEELGWTARRAGRGPGRRSATG